MTSDEGFRDNRFELIVEAPRPEPYEQHDVPRVRAGKILAVSTVAAVIITVAVLSIGSRPSGWFLMKPGPTYDLGAALRGDPTYPPEGVFLLTTVYLSELNDVQAIYRRSFDRDDVVRAASTWDDTEESERSAQLAAERYVGPGRNVFARPAGVVFPDGAYQLSEPISADDVLVEFNGVPVNDVEGLTAAYRQYERLFGGVGSFDMTISDADGVERTVSGEFETGGLLEVGMATRHLPSERLHFDLEGVEGASGGLMMTLVLLDAEFRGDLTAGLRIAGTGTIDSDGAVGPVKGVHYKVEGAVRDGADVFFAPAGSSDALTQRGGIDVVFVSNLEEAVEWLCERTDDQVCAVGRNK